MRKIVNTFITGETRYGITMEINNLNVVIVTLYKEGSTYSGNWIEQSQIYGHQINHGEKIIYVRDNHRHTCFNLETSELEAAELYTISWLETLSYETIRYHASFLE